MILSAKVVKRPDGTSKGYGFVCFERRSDALAAVEGMNGFAVGGKRLKVSMKKTPEECLNLQVQKLFKMSEDEHKSASSPTCSAIASPPASSSPSAANEREFSLFVFHLPPHWDDDDLKKQFEPVAPVVAAKVCRKEDGSSKGYGFVTCKDPRSAALAILNLNGLEICGKRLKVQPKQLGASARPRPECTVFVFHLPNDWTDSIIKQVTINEHVNVYRFCSIHRRQGVPLLKIEGSSHPTLFFLVCCVYSDDQVHSLSVVQFFTSVGRVVSGTVQRDARGRSRGFGFVTFERLQSAHDAVVQLSGVCVGNKRLKVSLKRTCGETPQPSMHVPEALYGQTIPNKMHDGPMRHQAMTGSDASPETIYAQQLRRQQLTAATWNPSAVEGGQLYSSPREMLPHHYMLNGNRPESSSAPSATEQQMRASTQYQTSGHPPPGHQLLLQQLAATQPQMLQYAYAAAAAAGRGPRQPALWAPQTTAAIPYATTHPSLAATAHMQPTYYTRSR